MKALSSLGIGTSNQRTKKQITNRPIPAKGTTIKAVDTVQKY